VADSVIKISGGIMSKEAPLCILIALILYTLGLYHSRQYKAISAVMFFAFGLAFDAWGTWQMSLASIGIGLDWHAYLGWLAIGSMSLLVTSGLLDWLFLLKGGPKRLRKLAPWATGIWYASFASGVVKHIFHVW